MQAYDDASLPSEESQDAFGAARAAFEALTATLAGAEAGGWTHDRVEEHLERNGREVPRLLSQEHLDLRALRERHAVAQGRTSPAIDASGTVRRNVEPGHTRHPATVFATVRVTRCAWRADGARNLCPADAALNLPERLHPHGLQRRAAVGAVRSSFDSAHTAITQACGNVARKRQVEQPTVAAAADIDAFYQASAPQPATDETLLVCSVDGKGVVMRPEALRDETRKAAAIKGAGTYRTRLASGEKQGRKRMATLGTVYDADPAPRRPPMPSPRPSPSTPMTVLVVGRAARARSLPPSGPAGSIATTSEQVIASVFDQAEQRDPTHRRTWVVLVDGARHQLDLLRAEAARRKVPIHILVDLIHVLEYLWKAAWCFYQDGDPAAEPWVAAHAVRILAGDIDAVITALHQQATDAELTPQQRGGVDTCIGYLTAKKQFLGYDTALAAGWPIATGVTEGAWCATRRAAASPAQPGRTRREVLGPNGLPGAERRTGTRACQQTAGRVQALGTALRKTRVIWRRPDCLKPNLQSTELHVRRKDARNRCRALPRRWQASGATFGAQGDAQRGHPRR